MLNLKEKFKNFGWGLLGVSFFVGLILLWGVLIWGIAAVSGFLYPIFSTLTAISILIFLFIVLPLSLIHKCRLFLAGTSIVLSMICGVTVWMYSFLVIVGFLGWIAIFLFLFFHFVAPIAAIGLFFKGQWLNGLSIITGLLFTYGMRFYSFWLGSLYEKKGESLIEIEPRVKNTTDIIIKFKKMCLVNIISYVVVLIGAIIIGIYLPNLYEKSSIFRIFFIFLTLYLMTIWITLLVYLYKASKILKLSGKLGVRPSLILIFTIVSTYTWFLLSVIPFIIVWIKSTRYLKYKATEVEIS